MPLRLDGLGVTKGCIGRDFVGRGVSGITFGRAVLDDSERGGEGGVVCSAEGSDCDGGGVFTEGDDLAVAEVAEVDVSDEGE
jgi:hypothetical protein